MDHPVVVIAGGSRGIGRATAHVLARRGARLVLAARDAPALAAAAAEVRAQGGEVLTVAADLRIPEDVRRVIDAAVSGFGRIDVWVGAAGVLAYGSVEQLPTDVFRRVLETNVVAHVDAVRAVLPLLRAQGGGRIVLIGSLYSRIAAPSLSAYAASKFALLGFARALQQELIGSGIDVRVVLPATIDTAIYRRAINFSGRVPHPLPPVVSPYRVARAISRAARGRGARIRAVGAVQSAAVPLSAAAPRVYDALIRTLMATIGLRGPAADTTAVLEAPDRDDGSVTGGWRSPARAVAVTAAAAAAAAAGVAWLARRRPR